MAVTLPVAPTVDPSAPAFASRRAASRGSAWSSPTAPASRWPRSARPGASRAAGGTASSAPPQAWREPPATAVADRARRPARRRPRRGRRASPSPTTAALRTHWDGFAPASLTSPRCRIAAAATTSAHADRARRRPMPPTISPRVERAPAALRDAPLPLLDPAPADRTRRRPSCRRSTTRPPSPRAASGSAAGDFEKIVLAREVAVHAPSDHDAAAVFGVLRAAFAVLLHLLRGRGDAAFVAASPELLVRRDGLRAKTVALAGSIRRSADPAVDDHLGEQLLRSAKDREEQAIVARRIAAACAARGLGHRAGRARVVKVANIQHLATPIRAQLREPVRALDLAGLLHPTPAVGAEPRAAARRSSPRSRAWTAAGTPAPSAGRTRPRTASSASPCAARSCAAARPAATPASASSATPTPPPSSPRPRPSSARSSRSSAGSKRHRTLRRRHHVSPTAGSGSSFASSASIVSVTRLP